MAYEVWVSFNGTEWTFTEDPDGSPVADDLTVLAGMRFGWSMPGPLWPVQPSPMQASVQLNLPDFYAAGLDRAADGDWLAIEVKLDSADTVCIARFYGDVTDYDATPRDGRPGVTLSVVAVDYTVRLREEYHPPYVVVDDSTPWFDDELIADFWARGDENGLGEAGSTVDFVAAHRTIDDAYLNLDGPLPITVPAMVAKLLDGAVNAPGDPLGRMVLSAYVATVLDVPYHGMRADGIHVGTLTGAFYALDPVNVDLGALTKIWEVPADAVDMESFKWTNVKGSQPAWVTTSGWGGDQQAQTYSPVTGATGRAGADVPVLIQDEVNAQSVSDFYAATALFEPWQVDRFTIPVTRFLSNGGDPRPVTDLNAGTIELFPDWTLTPADAGRAYCYSTGIVITEVEDTRTPDGLDFVQGVLVGAECVITDGADLELVVAIRRADISVSTYVDATLTVPAATVGGSLTGFVTRVDLSTITDSAWWVACASDGGNIRVYDLNGVTPLALPVDVAWINTGTQTGEIWFQSDLTTADNVFSVRAETGLTMPARTDPLGGNAVWAGYETVVTPGSDYRASVSPFDRTGGGAVPAIVGTGVTLTADGWLWAAGGATGYVKITGVSYLGTTFTMGCRTRQSVNDVTQRTMMSYAAAGNTNGQDRISLKARQVGTDRYAITTNVGGDLLSTASWKPSTYLNTFLRWNVVHDASTTRYFYAEGALASSTAAASTGRPSNADALLLGTSDAVSTTSGLWRGEVAGPVYIRTGILSPTWIAAEALSWNSPATFYDIT